jgi:hypothetical protein
MLTVPPGFHRIPMPCCSPDFKVLAAYRRITNGVPSQISLSVYSLQTPMTLKQYMRAQTYFRNQSQPVISYSQKCGRAVAKFEYSETVPGHRLIMVGVTTVVGSSAYIAVYGRPDSMHAQVDALSAINAFCVREDV